MKEAHIHEVLIDMQDGNKSFLDKKEFVDYVVSTFGKDCIFHSCSEENMDADGAYDFLVRRNKIVINNQKVALHPSMTMCDGHSQDKHGHHH